MEFPKYSCSLQSDLYQNKLHELEGLMCPISFAGCLGTFLCFFMHHNCTGNRLLENAGDNEEWREQKDVGMEGKCSGMICIQWHKIATCFKRTWCWILNPHSFHTQHTEHTPSAGCTLDRRARFSSSSSRSLSCRISSCNGSWETVKDSLKRSGVEQLESVSLSSEAMETIRSRSSFFDSSCCSWLT